MGAQTASDSERVNTGMSSKSGVGCRTGRKGCFEDDPYYIVSMIFACTIVAVLVVAYCYCKVRDIDREGHVDSVITDSFGHIVQPVPHTMIDALPDMAVKQITPGNTNLPATYKPTQVSFSMGGTSSAAQNPTPLQLQSREQLEE